MKIFTGMRNHTAPPPAASPSIEEGLSPKPESPRQAPAHYRAPFPQPSVPSPSSSSVFSSLPSPLSSVGISPPLAYRASPAPTPTPITLPSPALASQVPASLAELPRPRTRSATVPNAQVRHCDLPEKIVGASTAVLAITGGTLLGVSINRGIDFKPCIEDYDCNPEVIFIVGAMLVGMSALTAMAGFGMRRVP